MDTIITTERANGFGGGVESGMESIIIGELRVASIRDCPVAEITNRTSNDRVGEPCPACITEASFGRCERVILPQANGEKDRQHQPRKVQCQDDRQVRRGVRSGDLLTQYNEYIRKQHAPIKNSRNANPFFSTYECINCGTVERTVENHIQPDGVLPPLGSGHEQRIKCLPIRMDQAYHGRRWPGGLLKLIWIRNDQLLDIHGIRNK